MSETEKESEEVILNVSHVKKIKILILDDDKSTLKFLEALLKKRFDIVTISNASDLFTTADRELPDLILLDLNMPNIDGFEVLNIVKNHSGTASLPIVCMSSDDSSETRNRIRNSGASGFIKKPFKNDNLIADIEALIKSLNKIIFSANKRRSFTIAHNDSEKYTMIHHLIKQKSQEEGTIVFLSWIEGEDFLTEFEEDLIAQDKLVYLQIKPSLIVKFPFIQEVSPIFQEMFTLMPPHRGDVHLIFDELRNILNVYDPERALAKSYTLSAYLNSAFKYSYLFNSRPSQSTNALLLEKMARIFVGKGF